MDFYRAYYYYYPCHCCYSIVPNHIRIVKLKTQIHHIVFLLRDSMYEPIQAIGIPTFISFVSDHIFLN